ncbi:MAG TPA: cytochrome c [Ilumatobacteraceae bacterium]|nr:cytochrome c [Ilumatobacteraceae bacterium]
MPAIATTSIAWVLLAIMVVGWITYAALNAGAARRELGSEIELAANRKPYLADEELEGRRLEVLQLFSLVMLVIMVIGLPLYWILEPSRMAGATRGQENRFVNWGSQLFAPTAENGFNCAGCHGGMKASGGVAPFNITDGRTGEVNAVDWYAPALNTVFYRFDEEEVRFIIVYGRAFSPMSPWGLEGGGPLNDQQVDTLLAYIKSIQIEREDCGPDETDPLLCESGHLPADDQADIDELARRAVEDGEFATYGEALFNLDLSSGAYSCARCHTPGWSWGDPGVSGQGAFGWNLTDGAVDTHFPNKDEMIDFIKTGSELGAKYGTQGQGSGRMPGFGSMLTDEQIDAIVDYVRSL